MCAAYENDKEGKIVRGLLAGSFRIYLVLRRGNQGKLSIRAAIC